MAKRSEEATLAFLQEYLSDLEEADFLTGPDHGVENLDIDPVFATPWDEIQEDMAADLGIPEGGVRSWIREQAGSGQILEELNDPPGAVICVAQDEMGFAYGVAAIDPSEGSEAILGAYTGCQLGVAEAWRGRGIATRLVRQRFLCDGGLPTWHLDAPAYSPGGQAVHIAAYNLLYDELERLREFDGAKAEPETFGLDTGA